MEMGHRDLRRGGTKQVSKKQSGSAKSKKGMLKKLSYDEFSSDLEKKKSKFLKKSLKESNNGVDHHASVPRKLRSSAMKKRNLEPVSKLSSGSKRLNRCKTGIESYKKDLIKKENQETEAVPVVSESMMISKDEKEVAETLYGLAGMFTETSSIDKKTSESLSDEKETSKVESVSVVEADFTKAELVEPAVAVLSSAKTNLIDEMQLQQSDKQHNSTRMVDFLDRLKQNSSVNLTNEPAGAIETKVATCDMDYKSNGLGLWPGLSSTVLSKPSSTKLPPWMGQAVPPSKNASLLSETLRVQPRKLNRCASHIYISRLIKVLQSSKNSPLTPNQIEQTSSEMSQCGLPEPVTTTIDFRNMVPSSKRYQPQHLHDIQRTYNPKPVQENMTQLAYGPQTSQKPSFDFLSLSSTGTTQPHFPAQNSFPHYHHGITAYNQHSPATSSHQVQQMSPYLASRFQTAYNANQQQQQQLQKRLWASQYRPQTSGNTAPSSNQYIVKPNLSLNLTSSSNIQPLQVASSPRYNSNVSQQQHRLMAAAAAMSMNQHHHHNNPSRTVINRQEHRVPLIYEDTRTPLQLLCNEQT